MLKAVAAAALVGDAEDQPPLEKKNKARAPELLTTSAPPSSCNENSALYPAASGHCGLRQTSLVREKYEARLMTLMGTRA
jgi:hypothetical protein